MMKLCIIYRENMNNNMHIYTDRHFSEQLKKFRKYRGYKKQAILCKQLNISRQVWSLWELNKRKPTIPQLINIANFLKVDVRYFFITGAAPEDFDLIPDTPPGRNRSALPDDRDSITLLMPFVETTASRQLFRVFDQCRIRRGIYTITVCSDSGTTRSLQQYSNCNPGAVIIMEEFHWPEENPDTFAGAELVIFDDADKLPDKLLIYIITTAGRDIKASIMLTGKKINEILTKNDLHDHIDARFSIDCITTGDFDRIVKASLPEASETVLNFLRIETGMQLEKLAEIVREIEKEKKGKIKFILTINSLMKLCNQI